MRSHRLLSFLAVVVVALSCLAPTSSAQSTDHEVVDRIVAVVGDRIVLASEVAGQIQMAFLQSGRQPTKQAEIDSVRQLVVDQMISDQLFLIAAREDTMITVRDEEVEQALDDHVARIASRFQTNDEFLEALAAEGFTLRDFKRQYRDEVRNQILKQRFVQRRLYDVSVSRYEVEEFFATYEDSIPTQPEAVKLAHILLTTQPSRQIEDSVQQLAGDLRQRVLDGANFAAISSQYSGLGAGATGGDLGYVSRDDLIPELSRPAFNLDVGDVSGVVRSPLGYHVLTCEGKKGEQIKLRHIVLPVTPSAADSAMTLQLADSLLAEARGGADFRELSKVYSADDGTRAQGGELGWFALEQLPPTYARAVAGWKTPGEYRGPVVGDNGIHLLKLLDYKPEKRLSLDEDYDQLKEMARQEKTAVMVEEWIDDLKGKTYIDVRQ